MDIINSGWNRPNKSILLSNGIEIPKFSLLKLATLIN